MEKMNTASVKPSPVKEKSRPEYLILTGADTRKIKCHRLLLVYVSSKINALLADHIMPIAWQWNSPGMHKNP